MKMCTYISRERHCDLRRVQPVRSYWWIIWPPDINKPVNREESHAGHLRSSKGLKNLVNKIDNSACWLSRYELRPGVGAILATICNFSRIAKNVFCKHLHAWFPRHSWKYQPKLISAVQFRSSDPTSRNMLAAPLLQFLRDQYETFRW